MVFWCVVNVYGFVCNDLIGVGKYACLILITSRRITPYSSIETPTCTYVSTGFLVSVQIAPEEF